MTDTNRELVPDNCMSLVKEKSAVITGLCSERWHSKHSGVCRRAETPGRSVKVKKTRLFCGELAKIRWVLINMGSVALRWTNK